MGQRSKCKAECHKILTEKHKQTTFRHKSQQHFFGFTSDSRIAMTWKQPKCPSAEVWIRKTRYIYTVKYCFCCYLVDNCVWLFVTPWTAAHQAPPSIGFLRQEYWSGLPFFSPGGLTDPGIKLTSSAWQAGSLPMSHQKVNVKVAQSCPTLCDPMDPMEFSMPEYWSG